MDIDWRRELQDAERTIQYHQGELAKAEAKKAVIERIIAEQTKTSEEK